MSWNFFKRRKRLLNGVLTGNYMDTKVFYAFQFGQLPNISMIPQIDSGKAFLYIKEHLNIEIVDVYQSAQFSHAEQKLFFNMTVFVLRKRRLIELGPNYAELFYNSKDYAWANNLVNKLAGFKLADTAASPPVIGFTVSAAMN